jgi:hypothetical protein
MKSLLSIMFLLPILFVLTFSSVAVADYVQSVILGWDANTEPDMSHYTLYVNDVAVEPTIPHPTTTTTYTPPAPGEYFFKLTASDTSNNESGFSNIVSAVVIMVDTTFPTGPINLKIEGLE